MPDETPGPCPECGISTGWHAVTCSRGRGGELTSPPSRVYGVPEPTPEANGAALVQNAALRLTETGMTLASAEPLAQGWLNAHDAQVRLETLRAVADERWVQRCFVGAYPVHAVPVSTLRDLIAMAEHGRWPKEENHG